uniref:ATP synthase subunit epsilon, mitochondrial n=1 Tax=Steinernema glaseri TaxID=37863 RepID=A0A1I7YE58_9BILA
MFSFLNILFAIGCERAVRLLSGSDRCSNHSSSSEKTLFFKQAAMQWRTAGINYVRYSQIAAQVVRQCVKESKSAAQKKNPATLKVTPWEKGEPVKKDQ